MNSYTNYWYNGLKSTKKTYITADKQVWVETLNDFRGNVVYEKTNGETKRTSRYYANGQLARQTDALDNITKYEYGKLNKLERTYVPFSTNNNVSDNYSITENSYDKNGNLTAVKQTVQEENDSVPKYSLTKNQYNAQGLLVKVTLSDGTANSDINITKYFYNNAGIQTMMYTGLNSESDTEFVTTYYTHDAWGRPINTYDSTGYDSGTTTYDLNGNVISSTDANGNVTTNTYDALGRLLTENTIATDTSKNVSKSNTYDSMGRVTITSCNGMTTSYQYDALEIGDNYSSFRGFFYIGISLYYEREIVGINHLLMYSYKSYEYDAEMRLSNVKESGNQTVSYTYDANGNKASETLANGVVSNYIYNNANKIRRIENYSNNTLISAYDYTYYLDGSDASKTRTENGVVETTSYEYDALKRLVEENVTIGNNTTDTYSYEYDDYDNRSQMTVTGTENYVTEYSYNDAQGNYTALLQREVKTSENTNDLLNPTLTETTTYTYDGNGNQIRKTAPQKTESYTYDGLNQLIAYSDGDNTSYYKYNTNGLRYEKTVNGQRINHVWNAAQQIIADIYHGDYYEADCYIRGTNLAAKYRYLNAVKSDYTYYIQNAHGDVVNLADSTGAITKTYKYDAFGVEKNIDDSDVNAFRYCGEYFDNETGTIYLRARYYAPTTGRFISRDSNVGKIGEPLSLNLYTYCHNNPIGFADFNGHERIVVSGGIDGEENFPYQFVETALKQVSDWQFDSLMKAAPNKWGGLPQIPENDITWIVADWNYPEHKLRSFRNTARERNINFMTISDKQELFDYINKDDREKDPIEAMSFFSHGTAFDVPGVSNPGYKNQYALALGYGGSGKHNNSLNIFTSEISQINSKSFAKNSSTVFYSCRTGKKFNNVSFAQEWANTTGGTVKAATNRTDYTHIYPNPIPGLDSINSILGYSGRSPRQEARYIHGYSTSGSKNYPKGKWKTFTPK